MKSTADAILRTEQADYLDALHANAVRALAVMAAPRPWRAAIRCSRSMEARAADRGYPISDPEVACFLAIVARLAQPTLVVELGTNIGYGAIVLARAAGPRSRVVTHRVQTRSSSKRRAASSPRRAFGAHRGAPRDGHRGARED